jgi:plasmid stabilization system protein ParE
MPALRKHPLVRVDLQKAYDWLEEQETGLGEKFQADFIATYRQLRAGPQHFPVRFAGIRRLNLTRFRYGIFYVITDTEIRVLAVLHASRRHHRILAARRRSFDG